MTKEGITPRGYAVTRFHFGFRSLVFGRGKGLIDLLYIIIYNKLIYINNINRKIGNETA